MRQILNGRSSPQGALQLNDLFNDSQVLLEGIPPQKTHTHTQVIKYEREKKSTKKLMGMKYTRNGTEGGIDKEAAFRLLTVLP